MQEASFEINFLTNIKDYYVLAFKCNYSDIVSLKRLIKLRYFWRHKKLFMPHKILNGKYFYK